MVRDPLDSPGPFLGPSEASAGVRAFLEKAASVSAPVLLIGESGTGKSHLARLLHGRSPRSGGPFVSVNCAGVPDGLFEAEFFGHRRGSFTGASESRAGLFEQASEGTLFLDEVGELPPHQQAKLLSVLEEGRVRRVGDDRVREVDVRIVAATCRDLEGAVARGGFRTDLYHRLALLRCEVPPLRARPADLGPLVKHLLATFGARHGLAGAAVSGPARRLLERHSWPGNVRELAHVLEAALILAGSSRLEPEHLQAVMGSATPDESRSRYSFFGSPEEERETILRALSKHRGNRTRAARELGMSRNTLRTRMRRYDL